MRTILTTGCLLMTLLGLAGCANKEDDSAAAINKLCSSDKSCPGTLTCGKGASDRAQCVERCAKYGPGLDSGCPEDTFCYVPTDAPEIIRPITMGTLAGGTCSRVRPTHSGRIAPLRPWMMRPGSATGSGVGAVGVGEVIDVAPVGRRCATLAFGFEQLAGDGVASAARMASFTFAMSNGFLTPWDSDFLVWKTAS